MKKFTRIPALLISALVLTVANPTALAQSDPGGLTLGGEPPPPKPRVERKKATTTKKVWFVSAPNGGMPNAAQLRIAAGEAVESCEEGEVVCHGLASQGNETSPKNQRLKEGREQKCLDAVSASGGEGYAYTGPDYGGLAGSRGRGARLTCYRESFEYMQTQMSEVLDPAREGSLAHQLAAASARLAELERCKPPNQLIAGKCQPPVVIPVPVPDRPPEPEPEGEWSILAPLKDLRMEFALNGMLNNADPNGDKPSQWSETRSGAGLSGGALIGVVFPIGDGFARMRLSGVGHRSPVNGWGWGGLLAGKIPITKIEGGEAVSDAVIFAVPEIGYLRDEPPSVGIIRYDALAGGGVQVEMGNVFLNAAVYFTMRGIQGDPFGLDPIPLTGRLAIGMVFPQNRTSQALKATRE